MLEHEGLRAFGVLLLEEAGVGPFEERGPHLAAEGVAELVADHGGSDDGKHDQPEWLVQDLVVGHQQARGEQQGVPGQEEADDQPGFGEDGRHDADQVEGGDELFGVEQG